VCQRCFQGLRWSDVSGQPYWEDELLACLVFPLLKYRLYDVNNSMDKPHRCSLCYSSWPWRHKWVHTVDAKKSCNNQACLRTVCSDSLDAVWFRCFVILCCVSNVCLSKSLLWRLCNSSSQYFFSFWASYYHEWKQSSDDLFLLLARFNFICLLVCLFL
jgi:hypothetical protein